MRVTTLKVFLVAILISSGVYSAQKTLPTLPSATGPLVGTDILLCREGADTSDNKCTVNQLKAAIVSASTALGPASPCTDDQIARWDGASSTQLQCSPVTIADTTGAVAGVQSIAAKSDGTGVLTLDGDTATAGKVTVQPNGVLLLNYNGTTTGVRLYRSGSILVVTNGDDSAYLDLAAGSITATGNALVAGDIVITAAGGDIILEGDTADDNEATLTVAPLTSDRTATLPDSSGSILLTSTLVHKICTTIESPTATDNLLLVRMDAAATVTGIHCLVADGTSVVATYRECDGNGANCSDIESAITCGTTDTANSGGIDNSSLDAGDWVRLVLGTNTGTVTQLSACIYYTVN